jgi:hypothetical protein
MKKQELADHWIKAFEDGSGRKVTPEEEERIRGMADKADPNNPPILLAPTTKLPTVEEYRQRQINVLRFQWSKLVEHCREIGEPEPDPAKLAGWEAGIINSRGAEMMVENAHVSKAWSEALHAGDPTALKCQADFVDSMGNRDWNGWEHIDMINKWYIANRGELKFPFPRKTGGRRHF